MIAQSRENISVDTLFPDGIFVSTGINRTSSISEQAMATVVTLDQAHPARDRMTQLVRPGQRTLLIVLGGLLLAGAAAWGIRWWAVVRFIESTDDAYLQADSMTVAPKVSGYVAKVYVADNESVSAGQPLVQLDSRQYEAALEQANATIAAR